MEAVGTGKKTIMVVDDNTEFVEVVRKLLQKGGYAVECVYNGLEAIKRAEQKKPDLIVLDVVMPEMNGFQVLARLKAVGETSSIPVILVTAKNENHDIVTGYQLGGDYYLTKPFSGNQLISGVDLLLNNGTNNDQS
jgi:CheY-like chemotaxis protein